MNIYYANPQKHRMEHRQRMNQIHDDMVQPLNETTLENIPTTTHTNNIRQRSVFDVSLGTNSYNVAKT